DSLALIDLYCSGGD
ncbi:hypothetical protein A2U01_0087179, partial [Trifolium medium]|nr:hypothetical protein [Trifolium medium]